MKDRSSLYLGLGTALLVVGLFVGLALLQKSERQNLTTRELALSCTTDMATEFHIHPELSIIVGDEEVAIPEGVGIKAGCMNPLHTHDEPGVIHVESPEPRDFTLGDFFAVWGEPLERDGYGLTAVVDGEVVADPESLILRDQQQIELQYINL